MSLETQTETAQPRRGRPAKTSTVANKICHECKLNKDINEFYKIKPFIYHPSCKACTLKARKARHHSTYVKKTKGIPGLPDNIKAQVFLILYDDTKTENQKVLEIAAVCSKTPSTIQRWIDLHRTANSQHT